MSKKIKEIEAEEAGIKKAEAKLKKQKAALDKKSLKLREWRFRCKKCGLAFTSSEIGYKDWEVRRTKMKCQPMGDYDMWQVVETQHLACCPKCGHDFDVKVCHSDFINSTPYYSRWEEKPELKDEYKRLVNKKIHKVDEAMVKYMSEPHWND